MSHSFRFALDIKNYRMLQNASLVETRGVSSALKIKRS